MLRYDHGRALPCHQKAQQHGSLIAPGGTTRPAHECAVGPQRTRRHDKARTFASETHSRRRQDFGAAPFNGRVPQKVEAKACQGPRHGPDMHARVFGQRSATTRLMGARAHDAGHVTIFAMISDSRLYVAIALRPEGPLARELAHIRQHKWTYWQRVQTRASPPRFSRAHSAPQSIHQDMRTMAFLGHRSATSGCLRPEGTPASEFALITLHTCAYKSRVKTHVRRSQEFREALPANVW